MLKRIFIVLVLISLSKDQTQNNASVRCFVFPDFTYAVVKVLLELQTDFSVRAQHLINQIQSFKLKNLE
ncbi:hypothetical protein FZZ92_12795 [Synechococcus sp. MU1611]|nr:hypothetical protein [Synechococcus sp. MU1611]